MANWSQRVRKHILLVAPDGTEFKAKWIKDTRSISRRVALFSFPYINGNVGQDIGANSFTHPITFYFDGANNDLQANEFINKARSNAGPWNVTHPLYGFRELQLLSAKTFDNPLESGNVTAVETEWIELIDPDLLATAAELVGQVNGFAEVTNENALSQYDRNLDSSSSLLVKGIKNTAGKIQGFADSALKPLADLNSSTAQEFFEIQRSIQDTLNATVFEPLQLAAQFQALTQLPLKAIADVKARLSYYKDFAAQLLGITPQYADPVSKNDATLFELNMVSAITANTLIVTSGSNEGFLINGFISRAEAIDTSITLNENNRVNIDAIETAQTVFEDSLLIDQFFAQTESYNDVLLSNSLATQFLIDNSYNLRTELRFNLKKYKTPLQVVIEEYGSTGENDSLYDLFLTSNGLTGDEIYLLPPNKEVVVYV